VIEAGQSGFGIRRSCRRYRLAGFVVKARRDGRSSRPVRWRGLLAASLVRSLVVLGLKLCGFVVSLKS